jgi:hypothetical protein
MSRHVVTAFLFALSPLLWAQQPGLVLTLEHGQVYGYANADYNDDGLQDHFATGHDADSEVIWYTQPDRSYVAGPAFRGYVSPDLKIDRHGCAAADFNLDGRMDFYCAIGASKGLGRGNNELWLQQPDGSFLRDVLTHGASDPYGRGRQPVVFHLNRGRTPDLFLVNKGVPRPDGEPNVNHVYLNDGSGKFAEVKTIATVAMDTTCQGKADINQDGLDDLFVCPIGQDAIIYINNGKKDFELLPLPMADKRWWTAHIRRIDSDRYPDLVVSTVGGQLQVFLNTGNPDRPFNAAPDWFAQLPSANGVSLAIGDLDGDHRHDIYVVMRQVVDFTGPDCAEGIDTVDDVVFMSKGVPRNTWRTVQLVQGYRGCGYEAAYLGDGRISLSQGGTGWSGPQFVLDWGAAPIATAAPSPR